MLFVLFLNAARAADAPPTDTSAAATPVASTPAAPTPSGTEAERLEQYKERVVLFEDWVGISASTGAVVSTWTVPKKGVYGEPLNGGKFYDYIGHKDLGDVYRKRYAVSLGLRAGGLALGVGGLALALANLSTDCEFVGTALYPQADSAAEARDLCRAENASKAPASTAGYVLAGVGTVALGVGFYIPVHPVKDFERKKMAAEYNKQLAVELGLNPEVTQ